jgi:hypothetical protein
MNMLTRTFKYAFISAAFCRKAFFWMPLAITAICGAGTAHADWTKVDSYDAGTYYIETDKVKRSGYSRIFWSVLDYKSPQKTTRGLAYQSTRTHMDIDCRQKTVLILSFSMHSGPMLAGEVIDTQGVMRDRQSIPPDTPLEKLHKLVCTR